MTTVATCTAGVQLIMAIAETVREAREVPSGTLYAAVMGKVDLEGYNKVLGILTGAGLVRVTPGHLVQWCGPEGVQRG